MPPCMKPPCCMWSMSWGASAGLSWARSAVVMNRFARKRNIVRMVLPSCGLEDSHFFIIAPSRSSRRLVGNRVALMDFSRGKDRMPGHEAWQLCSHFLLDYDVALFRRRGDRAKTIAERSRGYKQCQRRGRSKRGGF